MTREQKIEALAGNTKKPVRSFRLVTQRLLGSNLSLVNLSFGALMVVEAKAIRVLGGLLYLQRAMFV